MAATVDRKVWPDACEPSQPTAQKASGSGRAMSGIVCWRLAKAVARARHRSIDMDCICSSVFDLVALGETG